MRNIGSSCCSKYGKTLSFNTSISSINKEMGDLKLITEQNLVHICEITNQTKELTKSSEDMGVMLSEFQL
jgi:hypothetical protein